MIIAGLDSSLSSPGCVKFHLDDELNILSIEYLGFNSKTLKEYDNIINTKKLKFTDEIDRNIRQSDLIVDFLKDAEYVAIEGFSYGSPGRLAQLGEFIGIVKSKLYPLGVKMRIYDPRTVKMNACHGNGNADKYDMLLAYENDKCGLDLSMLPTIDPEKLAHRKAGISPLNDIVDAFWLGKLLILEMQLRKGLVSLKNLGEEKIKIFNRVTKANPVNILDTEFTGKQ